MGTPAKCLPVSLQTTCFYINLDFVSFQSSTALGATWDTKLVKEVGLKLLAQEAKLRAASLILAPTCNIQRVGHTSHNGPWALIYPNFTEPSWRTSTLFYFRVVCYISHNHSLEELRELL